MGPPKGRAHEKRLADMSSPLPEQRPKPWHGVPDPANSDTYSQRVTETTRIRHRLDHDDQWRLVDFAIIQQVLYRGNWVEVMRVDCCHEMVHVHRFTRRDPDGRREDLLPVTCQEDVDQGWKIAETLINPESWETNERRWRDG